jgi:hypothetical protein
LDIDGVPVVTEAFPKTVRLVTTARLREAVLKSLVDDEDELDLLAEIEQATSTRMIAQERGISDLAANELVYDVPHAHFINASLRMVCRARCRNMHCRGELSPDQLPGGCRQF